MRFPGFIGPSYVSQSVNVDCQRCVNLYPEMNDLGTGKEREVASLVGTPGLRRLLTLAESPVRGVHTASNGEVYAVGGTKLYSISSAWVATEIGTLNSSTGFVSMEDNGTHVVIVDGADGYSWNMTTDTFAEITDVDFLGADLITFQDGYFIVNKPDSGQFYISGINDITFDPLDISTAEASPDDIVGVISAHQNLYLLGTQSTEVFYNSGNAAFPFERIQGAIMEVGCAAAFSIAKVNGAVYWVGQDSGGFGIVYRAEGYRAERVSNPAVESVIRSVGIENISTARAWTYQKGGHYFYCLNLPDIDSTWVYDASTNLWHERTYLNLWGLERHRADCHTVAHGENIVGDYENGKIYALDDATYTDDSSAIVRMRTAPHISKELRFAFHSRFQLDMEAGVGLTGSGQGIDPQAVLEWSDDGGHTWSNEHWAPIGAIGNYGTRVIWRRLGRSRDRVYRVTISDPVKVVLIGADLMIEEGAA